MTDVQDVPPLEGGVKEDTSKAASIHTPCGECGDGSDVTQHCAHCGNTLCEKCRGEHIKGVIKELKEMKISAAGFIKTANERRGSITRSLKATEHIRAKAKFHLDEDFRSQQQSLENRKKLILNKLSTFGTVEQKTFQISSQKVKDCIQKVKNVEEKFNCRLSNYNPMTDPDFNELCQNYIDYTNQLNQLNDFVAQPDKIDRIVFTETSDLKTSIKGYGKIQFGESDKKKNKTQFGESDKEKNKTQFGESDKEKNKTQFGESDKEKDTSVES